MKTLLTTAVLAVVLFNGSAHAQLKINPDFPEHYKEHIRKANWVSEEMIKTVTKLCETSSDPEMKSLCPLLPKAMRETYTYYGFGALLANGIFVDENSIY